MIKKNRQIYNLVQEANVVLDDCTDILYLFFIGNQNNLVFI